MRFFALFIYRPVATILIAAAITLCGILGFRLLPVAPLPQVDFPVIMVSASLPGASPETMASSVATPLERSLGRIAGVNEMTSSSSLGSTRIILEFNFDRDINGAARDVQAAINAAQSLLPGGMPSRPTYRKANPSDAPIMILTLTSESWSQGKLYDFASTQLAQTIAQIDGAEMNLIYDRDTMSRLGIDVQAANSLLNNAFGQRQISTIYQPMNQYKVVMEVDPRYSQDISALEKMFVINRDGKAIPLSYFAQWRPANAPLSVNHQGLSAASTIAFNLPTGTSLSQATEAINRTMTQLGVPSTVRGSFSGTAQVFQQTMNSQLILIVAAIATVYIVLGILYESYVHPLTILSTLPSAGVGALLALELFNAPFSLIALIGIMLLIGIVKKNAIMMVDFALEAQRSGGLTPEQAIFQACLLRFRPIMMTTLAALFGALPLVLSGGDGSELRQPLGITIVGGLVMSQLLTLYTTPVVYLFFDRLRLRFSRKNSKPVVEI
ncbi:TPA: efflux RND transporter permease subunit [Salmonella enterica]|nr:efflux RND transporter permease subunit [Salmonella enterica]